MSFIEKLKICINESEYFEWYENNGFKILNYDSKKFIDDLIKYKVTKSKKKASFYRQLNLYEFKFKEKNTNKGDIFIHKNIIFNKFYDITSEPIKRIFFNKFYDITSEPIKRKSVKKRKRKIKNLYDDEIINDIIDIFDIDTCSNKNIYFENNNKSEFIIENNLPELIVY